MSLETEATQDTVTIEHFDREWTVPAKRHLSHIKAMKDEVREGFGLTYAFLAELFLGEEQFADLLKIDPVEDDLEAFGTKVAEALGLGDAGNSEPS